MSMQIGIEELINMIMYRMTGIEQQSRQLKDTQNVLLRALYKKKVIDKQDILDSLKTEFKIMKDLDMIKEMPKDEVIIGMRDEMVEWIEGNTTHIKKMMKEYEDHMKEEMMKNDSKIITASGDTLNALDNAMKNAPKGSKLIL